MLVTYIKYIQAQTRPHFGHIHPSNVNRPTPVHRRNEVHLLLQLLAEQGRINRMKFPFSVAPATVRAQMYYRRELFIEPTRYP